MNVVTYATVRCTARPDMRSCCFQVVLHVQLHAHSTLGFCLSAQLQGFDLHVVGIRIPLAMPRGDGGLSSLLRQLRERKQARWFLRPVDPMLDGVPNYLSIISRPMDLKTVGDKLDRGEYNGQREEFAHDVRLIFSNALEFNVEADNPVRKDAVELAKWFENKWSSLGSGDTKKRRIEKQGAPAKGELDTALSRRLLRSLMSKPEAYHFNEPVDAVALGIPEYHQIVKKPMDFSTVREKLEGSMYASNKEFAQDVRLVFSNAELFNPPGSEINLSARKLSELFEKQWPYSGGEKKRQKIAAAAPIPAAAAAPPPPPREKKRQKMAAAAPLPALGAALPQAPLPEATVVELPFLERETKRIIEAVVANDTLGIFCAPVDPVTMGIADYLDIIKEPMDFGTMRQKDYATFRDMVRDGRLVFANALQYNSRTRDPVRLAAIELSRYFEKLVEPLAYVMNLEQCIEEAYALESSLFFRKRVDPDELGIPDYLEVIKEPMSLDQMWDKLRNGAYKPPNFAETFLGDARLIVTNAQTFNSDPQHFVYQEATRFGDQMQTIFNRICGGDGIANHLQPQESLYVAHKEEEDKVAPAGESTETKKAPPKPENKSDLGLMRTLLRTVVGKRDLSWFFLEPVDPVALGIPDYFEVIKKPMDLGTIEKQLADYASVDDFAADVRLVFNNAMTYNKSPKLAVHDAAKRLLNIFEQRLSRAKTLAAPISLVVDDENDQASAQKKKQQQRQQQPKQMKATAAITKKEPHTHPSKSFVVNKITKVSAKRSVAKGPAPEKENIQTEEVEVTPIQVVDLSFVPAVIVTSDADHNIAGLEAIEFSKAADLEEKATAQKDPDPLWAEACAEARLRLNREALEAERQAQQLHEARELQRRRREEQLAEVERRRAEDEHQRQLELEEQRREQRDAELKRERERERARRDRANLGRTLDLEYKHTALASYIDNLEQANDDD